MKLIKLFEEFIAEAANPDYPVGEYDYSYVDKDFKPLGQPLKLTVTSVPELDNPEADWLMVRLIAHKLYLELYPLDPQNNLTIKTAQPGVFSHPAFKEANNNGKPNPWPAGTAYIRIYKKGEKPQVGKAADTRAEFKTGETYKYQLIDAMGKDVTQKTVTIKPSTNDKTTHYELPSTGKVLAYKVYGNYPERSPNIMSDLGPGLDLQSTTGQPNVFWHPDFNDINNKTIYQVRLFPN